MSHFMDGFGLAAWQLLAIGFVLGFLANRLAHLLHAFWLDHRRPLADGKRRSKWRAVAVDPRAGAAIVMIAVVGWSVYQTQENANVSTRLAAEAKAFGAKTRQCQTDLIQATQGSRAVTREYNRHQQEQTDALLAGLAGLLKPPPDVAALPPGSPARQEWSFGVIRKLFEQVQASRAEQIEADRRRPPLPDPRCD